MIGAQNFKWVMCLWPHPFQTRACRLRQTYQIWSLYLHPLYIRRCESGSKCGKWGGLGEL